MRKGKHSRKNFKIFEAYSVLIFIATLFICIGFAKVSDVSLNITGDLEADLQKGVFISDITNLSGNSLNSSIDYYIQTMFESKIELEKDINSTQTYKVSLYNNSNYPHVFIGVLTDKAEDYFYDNENIDFEISGLKEHTTIIESKQSLEFEITFKYKDTADVSNNILNSKLNFRFRQLPTLILSNEGETYTLNNAYPDFIPQEYQFSVKNYTTENVSVVPMKYSFDIEIDKPLSAKIYDENNNEISGSINISGDAQNKVTHSYILKIFWDDSNEESNTNYDSSKYEEKQFLCKVTLNAITDDEKYMDFTLSKHFNVNINSNNYKDRCDITYVDITNNNYPTEAALGENIELTFIKEIPGDVTVTGAQSFIYNKPTLTINNVTENVEIINTSGELIAYEHPGEYVFTGNNYINTEAALFSERNIDRDFVITFDIVEDDDTQAAYNTLLSVMNESGAPYPGFLFRIGTNDRIISYELTANSIAGKGKAYYNARETTKKVEIIRVNKILYAKVNDGEYVQMQDYTTFTNYFDVPVTFGAALNASGKPFRYFRGTLSNILVKYVNTSISEELLSNKSVNVEGN